ncbi:MAG: hypothetical protein JXQ72_16600 [Anaerolineae bacterium]|nr:hypothetical protein [Anaerolineae bacterium]
MRFPALLDWDDTRTGLHRTAQILGAIRAAAVEPEPNWVHRGLTVLPNGLTTGAISSVGEFILDFTSQSVIFDPPDHEAVGFALARRSQVSLADAIMQTVITLGYDVPLKREAITSKALLRINPITATHYASVLHRLAELLGRFRASLPGEKSPVIVWPHGFDLSFMWFATEEASEEAPHMAFGFSPSSAGLDRPYLYTYPYPLPPGVTKLDPPPAAHWHSQNWTGAIIKYDDLIRETNPEAVIEHAFRTIYAMITPLLTS